MVLIQTRNDDITGEPNAVTCVLILNGEGIEIDLAEGSVKKLVKLLEPYWAVGSPGKYDIQRRGVAARAKSNGTRPRATVEPRPPEVNREVRAWAIAEGIMSPQSRGRVPQAVVDQFMSRQT